MLEIYFIAMREAFQKILDKFEGISQKELLGLYFVFATFFMVYQHSMGWAWDFSVYSLNAEYLFHEGVYMEWKRPPLLPVILGLLQYLFSLRLAEYVFIVLNSGFFLYSVLRLSDSYDVDALYLYVFVMSPYILFYSALEGTELLFLSFIGLVFANLKTPKAGVWLGLAFLTRYTGAIFLVLLVFQRNFKKIIQSLILAGLMVLPWLVFNQITLGHPFASMIDSYALDVVERGLETPFKPFDIIAMTGLALPLMGYYLKGKELDYTDFVMIFASVLIVLRQLGTAIKVRRYLFDLSLPVAFLAAKGLQKTSYRKPTIYIIMFLYLGGSVFLLIGSQPLANPGVFQEASNQIGECKTVSNRWPMLSYAGTPTGPLETQFKSEEEYLEQGYKIAVFEEGDYSLRGDECIKGSFDSTYIERLDEKYGANVCSYSPIKTCRIERKLEMAFG